MQNFGFKISHLRSEENFDSYKVCHNITSMRPSSLSVFSRHTTTATDTLLVIGCGLECKYGVLKVNSVNEETTMYGMLSLIVLLFTEMLICQKRSIGIVYM